MTRLNERTFLSIGKTRLDLPNAPTYGLDLTHLAAMARVLAHPARLAVLRYLSETGSCITGDLSDHLPLSRTTVSQHLKELRDMGFIHGEIEGAKVNYCLCVPTILEAHTLFDAFLEQLGVASQTTQTKCTYKP